MSDAAPRTIDAIDITRIMRAIPHRHPFLLIDRVVEVKRMVSASATTIFW